MTAIVVLEKARTAGLTLTVEHGDLYARPSSKLTPELRPLIAANKVALIQLLAESASSYTLADLSEMDKLLRELAQLEEWPEDELVAALLQRRRMRPVDVPGALELLRRAHRAAVAVWPNTPTTRTHINFNHAAMAA